MRLGIALVAMGLSIASWTVGVQRTHAGGFGHSCLHAKPCYSCGPQCCEPNIVVHVCPTEESKHCRPKKTRNGGSSNEAAPAPIVESAPAFNPMMMATPVMFAAPMANMGYAPAQPRVQSEAATDQCADLRKRLDNLQDEMNRLIDAVEDNSRAVKRIAEIINYNTETSKKLDLPPK